MNLNDTSSQKKKLSSKEEEILDRQRKLAAARKNGTSDVPPPPIPTSRILAASQKRLVASQKRPLRSTSEILASATSSSSSSFSMNRGSKSANKNQHDNHNDNHNASNLNVNTKKRKRNQETQKQTQKQKQQGATHIIDLTHSPSISRTNSNSQAKPPPNPSIKRPSTKRPTIRNRHSVPLASSRGRGRPSSNNVEKAILASRSRVNQNSCHGDDDKKNAKNENNKYNIGTGVSIGSNTRTNGIINVKTSSASSSSYNSSGRKGGISSLLSNAGITQEQLLQTNPSKSSLFKKKRDKQKYDDYDDYNGDDDDNDGKELTMNTYFEAIMNWDFLSCVNNEMEMKLQHSRNKTNRSNSNNTHDTSSSRSCSISKNNNTQQEDQQQHEKSLPNVFTSKRQYQNLWAPLCLNETKAQILSDALSDISQWTTATAKSTSSGGGHNKNRGRKSLSCMDFIPVMATPHSKDVGTQGTSITLILQSLPPSSSSSSTASSHLYSKNNNETSHKNKNFGNSNSNHCAYNRQSYVSNDLLVLTSDKSIFQKAAKGQLHDENTNIIQSTYNVSSNKLNKAKALLGCMGVVEYGRKTIDGLSIKVSRRSWLQLSSGKKEQRMTILNLGCNVTNIREFSALCRIGTLSLLPYVLCKKMTKAKDSLDDLSEALSGNMPASPQSSAKCDKIGLLKSMGGTAELGRGFISYASEKFNSSQVRAISAAATEYGEGGFTLIKGPPGMIS